MRRLRKRYRAGTLVALAAPCLSPHSRKVRKKNRNRRPPCTGPTITRIPQRASSQNCAGSVGRRNIFPDTSWLPGSCSPLTVVHVPGSGSLRKAGFMSNDVTVEMLGQTAGEEVEVVTGVGQGVPDAEGDTAKCGAWWQSTVRRAFFRPSRPSSRRECDPPAGARHPCDCEISPVGPNRCSRPPMPPCRH